MQALEYLIVEILIQVYGFISFDSFYWWYASGCGVFFFAKSPSQVTSYIQKLLFGIWTVNVYIQVNTALLHHLKYSTVLKNYDKKLWLYEELPSSVVQMLCEPSIYLAQRQVFEFTGSYRPISILCNFAKLFQQSLYEQISTDVTQFIAEALNKRSQVDVIHTDFTKTFNFINHFVLLSKSNIPGFSVYLHQLMSSSLIQWFSYFWYGYQSKSCFPLGFHKDLASVHYCLIFI